MTTSPFVVIVTVCGGVLTGLPLASLTVAVAVDVDVPLATIDGGFSASVTWVGGTASSFRVAVPGFLAFVALAVMVSAPAVLEAVIVVVYVPSPLLVTVPNFTSPFVLKATVSLRTAFPLTSFTVAVALVVSAPSAMTGFLVKATATVFAAPNS